MLRLPRKSVRSHFGFEPQGGVSRQRTRASRLLFDLIRDADMEAASSSADIYMQFAVYDLVGALFAPTDPRPVSRSADKLFARICGVVRDGLLDPDFGPAEVASQAGISLRYVQKLFTERGTTCSEFIYSHRLDHAAHLLHRRALTGTGQPLSEIAYACGFRDYVHFTRRFPQAVWLFAGRSRGRGRCARSYRRKCVLGTRRPISDVLDTIGMAAVRLGQRAWRATFRPSKFRIAAAQSSDKKSCEFNSCLRTLAISLLLMMIFRCSNW